MNKPDNSKIRIGQIINVQAYKHDGKLYRQWNGAKVLFNDDEKLVLIMWKVKVSETDKKHWGYKEPVIWFFPKNHFYNSLILLKKTGHYTYINIASTPFFEEETLKYVDYDFDIKQHPNKELKLVDREEFHKNFVKLNYPEKLKRIAYFEITNLFNMYNDYQEIFNPKTIEYFIKLAIKDRSFNTSVLHDFIKNTSQEEVKNATKINRQTRIKKPMNKAQNNNNTNFKTIPKERVINDKKTETKTFKKVNNNFVKNKTENKTLIKVKDKKNQNTFNKNNTTKTPESSETKKRFYKKPWTPKKNNFKKTNKNEKEDSK